MGCNTAGSTEVATNKEPVQTMSADFISLKQSHQQLQIVESRHRKALNDLR